MNWSMSESYLRHCGALLCAPAAVNVTRQSAASAAPSVSEIRVPATPRATFTGTVWPTFHLDNGTGEKKPRIWYSTTYVSDAVAVLPALSVAVQSTLRTPGVDVSTESQL